MSTKVRNVLDFSYNELMRMNPSEFLSIVDNASEDEVDELLKKLFSEKQEDDCRD